MKTASLFALPFLTITLGAAAAHASNLPQTTNFTYSGSVNSQPLAASGTATYSDDFPSNVFNDILYTQIPDSYDPHINVTIINTAYCPKRSLECSLQNLGEVTGGNFNLERTIQVYDSSGSDLGAVLVAAAFSTLTSNTSQATVNFSGNYTGPVDLVSTTGYSQLLRQVGPGMISGVFTQIATTSTGEELTLNVSSLWRYASSGVLANDEYSNLAIDSTTYNPSTGRFTLSGTGYYDCAPVPTPLPLLGVGAALGYSRKLRKRIKGNKTPEVISAIG